MIKIINKNWVFGGILILSLIFFSNNSIYIPCFFNKTEEFSLRLVRNLRSEVFKESINLLSQSEYYLSLLTEKFSQLPVQEKENVAFILEKGDERRVFNVAIPKVRFLNDEQITALKKYLTNYLYNRLLDVYPQKAYVYISDTSLTEILDDVISKFQTDESYGHIGVELKEHYGEFKLTKSDRLLEEKNIPASGHEVNLASLGSINNFLVGVDVGGTDTKISVFDGKTQKQLLVFKYDWKIKNTANGEEILSTLYSLIKFAEIFVNSDETLREQLKTEHIDSDNAIKDFSKLETKVKELEALLKEQKGESYKDIEGIGIGWPETVINSEIKRGSSKTAHLTQEDFDEYIKDLGENLKQIFKQQGVEIEVELVNDATIGAVWAGVISAREGNEDVLKEGIEIYTGGTSFGWGALGPGSRILFVPNSSKVVILNTENPATAHGTLGIKGVTQKSLSQQGVVRLVRELGNIKLEEKDDLYSPDPDNPGKMKFDYGKALKEVQSWFNSSDTEKKDLARKVFTILGEYLAITIAETYYDLTPQGMKNKVLFGRLFRGESGEVLIESARKYLSENFSQFKDVNLYIASDLIKDDESDLMREFGQAIGAAYLVNKNFVFPE